MGNCQCADGKCCTDSNSNLNLHDIATKGSLGEERNSGLWANEVSLKIKTWEKETYSLFDYENQNHLKSEQVKVKEVGYLTKNGSQILYKEGYVYQKDANEEVLVHISKDEGIFTIESHKGIQGQPKKEQYDEEENKVEQTTKFHHDQKENFEERDEDLMEEDNENYVPQGFNTEIKNATNTNLLEKRSKIWLVVRSVQDLTIHHALKLKPGDIIKMGRVKFRIRDINLKNYEANSKAENELLRQISSSSVRSIEGGNQCRVCLSTAVTIRNPLVNPCKCAGTMKYIHFQCMQQWLRSKLHSRQNDNCIIYMWKNLECELCKYNYPPLFKSDETFFDLVELSKPKDVPYMLMEITQKKYEDCVQQQVDEEGNVVKSNGVYIVQFGKKNDLKIGRAHEAEVRINDISVSRQHASFKVIDGNVYLCDTKSKFGTLILVQENIKLIEEISGLETQIGRSVIEFETKKQQTKNSIMINNSKLIEQCLGRENNDAIMV